MQPTGATILLFVLSAIGSLQQNCVEALPQRRTISGSVDITGLGNPRQCIPGSTDQFTCPDANPALYPNPNDCTTFFQCSNGFAYIQCCPADLEYDPILQDCEYPTSGSCQGGSRTTTTTSTPTTTTTTAMPETTPVPDTTTTMSPTTVGTTVTPPGSFQCPEENGFFPIPGTCGQDFYSCVNGSPYVRTCPGTSIFDPEVLVCVDESVASCKHSSTAPSSTTTTPTPTTTSTTTTPTTTTPTTASPTTSKGPFVCPPGPGQYPYPGNCSLYYVCSNGNYIVATCPAGQVFNPELEFCDNPGNVPGCN